MMSSVAMAQYCNNPFTLKYECLSTSGGLIGYVGPFPEYYSKHLPVKNLTGVCMPDFPASAIDICEFLTASCNSKYHTICRGNCMAGDSGQGISCRKVCYYHNCQSHPSGQIYFLKEY